VSARPQSSAYADSASVSKKNTLAVSLGSGFRLLWAEILRTFQHRSLWITALIGFAVTGGMSALFWVSRDVVSQEQAHAISDSTLPGCLAIYSLVCMLMGGLAVTRDYQWSWMGRMSRFTGPGGLLAVKYAAMIVFAIVAGALSTLVCMSVVVLSAPKGYSLETTESWWKIAAGAVLCCPLACVIGCAIGFMLRKWLVTILVLIAVFLVPIALDGTEAGKYVSWNTLAGSMTLDPGMDVKLSFWWAVLDAVGLCAVLSVAALVVMRLRESAT